MFYVSKILSNKIGVTDTEDDKEEFLTDRQILDYYQKYKIFIYGVNYSGSSGRLSKEILTFNEYIDSDLVKRLLRGDGSRLSVNEMANYLAGLNLGNQLGLRYSYIKKELIGADICSTQILVSSKFIRESWDYWRLSVARGSDIHNHSDGMKFSSYDLAVKLFNLVSDYNKCDCVIDNIFDVRRGC